VFCTWFLVLAGPCRLPAQSIHQHFTIRDGLPHQSVYRLYQHSNGLLWMGTANGLCSYDGREFRTYTFADSIGQNSVMCIEPYLNDDLLVYLYRQGYYRFTNGKLVQLFPEIPGFPETIAMAIDADERIWLINSKRQVGYIHDRQFRPFALPPALPDASSKTPLRYLALAADRSGNVFLGTNRGLFRCHHGSVREVHAELFSSAEVASLEWHGDSSLLIGTDKGIYEMTGDHIRLLYALDGKEQVCKTLLDRQNRLWFFLKVRGVLVLQPGSDKPVSIASLEDQWFCDMLEDHEGNVWLATLGNGIYASFNQPPSLHIPGAQVRSITETRNGDIYIGGLGEIAVVTRGDTGRMQHFKMQASEQVMDIYEESPGSLVVATTARLLRRKGNAWEVLKNLETCFDVTGTPNGKVYAGSIGVLAVRDDTAGYFFDKDAFFQRVNVIHVDKKEILWMGGEHGIVCYGKGAFRSFTLGRRPFSDFVYDLLESPQGNLWIATTTGLKRMDTESGTVSETGLHARCRKLALDSSGRLWVATSSGVYRQEGEGFEWVFLPGDISAAEIQALAFDQRGRLWLGLDNGAMAIENTRIGALLSPPTIALGDVLVNGSLSPLSDTGLSCRKEQLNLEIHFRSVAFQMTSQVIYEYRLLGLNNQWIRTNEPRVFFHTLPPGSYTLEVRSGYKEGNTWSAPATWNFNIVPRFYQHWWFVLLCVGLAMGLITGLTWWRWWILKKRQEEKLVLKDQLNDLKFQAISTMINPHFVDNTLNSIQNLINNQHNKREINEYITRLSDLIRKSLKSASKHYITLHEELERLELYLSLEQIRLPGLLNYSIQIADNIEPEDVLIPNTTLQPLVENAIWHGIMAKHAPGQINILISEIDLETIQIVIQDNGVGYYHAIRQPAVKSRQSMGINLIKERLKLSSEKNQLTIEEGMATEGTGTKVTLRLKTPLLRL